MSKSVGIITKARKVLEYGSLKTLYFSFIYPYVNYCNINWGNGNQNIIWPIFKIQKLVIRLMFNLKRRSPTTPTFKKHGLIKVPDLYKISCISFMHNFYNGKLPDIVSDFFQENRHYHSHGTRASSELRPPKYRTKEGQRFIKKMGAEIWNKFIKDNGEAKSLSWTKNRMKMNIIENY